MDNNNMKHAKYITILDFSTGLVHQITTEKWDIENEDCETYLERIGFDSGNCHWMVHEIGGINFEI